MTTNPAHPEDRERLLNQGDTPDWQPVEKREKCRSVLDVPETMLEVYQAAHVFVSHRGCTLEDLCACGAVLDQCSACRLLAAVKADTEFRKNT